MRKIFHNLSKIIALLALIFMTGACTSRPVGVMSKRQMTDFLTDYHKLEGALQADAVFSGEQKKIYYDALYLQYGITPQNFDSSLVWYTKHPKTFEKIYTAVVENLKLLETDVKNRKYHPLDSAALRRSELTLWEKDSLILNSPDSIGNRLNFTEKSGELVWKDVYTLRFIHRILPMDSVETPKVIMRIFYHNKLTDSAVYLLHSDGFTRRTSIRMQAKQKSKVDSVSACLFCHEQLPDSFSLYFDSIRLVRRYDFFAQDSLLRISASVDSMAMDSIKTDTIRAIPLETETVIPKVQLNERILRNIPGRRTTNSHNP